MGSIRTEALVLRTLDFSESTQIAHFYSPTLGKFSAIARGVKRLKSRLGPRLEVCAQVELTAFAREGAAMATLSSIELVRHWPILQQDLKAYSLAALLIESMDRGTEEAKPSLELYHLGVGYLRQLQEGAEADSLTAHALLRLICLLGFAPDLRETMEAGADPAREIARNEFLFFHAEQGRLAASPPDDLHQPRLRLSGEMRDWLRASMGLTISEFARVEAPEALRRPLLRFVIELLQYDLEVELKSVRFLRKMIWEKQAG